MKVSADVIAVLDRCQFDGNGLSLPGQLDRKQYLAVNKVIEEAGGKWERRVGAHLFDGDAAEIIDQVILAGEVTAAHKVLGYFSTPPAVVARLVELAEIVPGMTVLEPSAGTGAIVTALLPLASLVVAVEIDPGRAARLRGESTYAHQPVYTLHEGDFLALPPQMHRYDRVVMNPPFAKQADIDHVTHALQFLRPGGRLVSVMSAGVVSRTNRKSAEFRDLLFGCNGSFEALPEGAFKASGTGVSAVIAVFPSGVTS